MGTRDRLSVLLESQQKQRMHFSSSAFMASLQPRQAHSSYRRKAEGLGKHTFLYPDLLSEDWDKMDLKQLRKEEISAG